ncbi:hypothetical protein CCAX7_58440 [Capsulimonas corticalis]|uniref:Uncharacterized protein n=1 Tax=Capsulimonas corticalis TaxID=2219043 RepID=A0A402CZX9_9BACT|nr:VOC family protein [Capsulimonas corticalis]BDI33793.1 hypothetical protein CCAX7_58440 [Capsulimonas corticalis]
MSIHPKNSPGFHHIAIRVADLAATTKLYTEGFGFKQTYNWGEGEKAGVLLDLGDGNYLEIFAGGKKPETDALPETGMIHFAVRTPDVDAAHARALAAGARETMAPKDHTIPGEPPAPIRISFVAGYDGEVIEFFNNELL